MIIHYINLELRNIKQNKLLSALKLLGLALGFTISFIIIQYTYTEFNYDSEQKAVNQKYLIQKKNMDFFGYSNSLPYPVKNFIRQSCPDVINATSLERIYEHGYLKTPTDLVNLNIEQFIFVEQNFFSFVNFKFIAGDPSTCFNNPAPGIISKNLADKYFLGNNSLGKDVTLRINNKLYNFTITAIVEPIQQNSNFNFEWISSIDYLKKVQRKSTYQTDWKLECENYIQLTESAGIENTLDKITAYYKQNLPEKKKIVLKSEHISDLNLSEDNIKKLILFTSLAILILVVSLTNYILLSTADSLRHLKQRGVELISGAKKPDMLKQYLITTSVNVIIAIFISIGITFLCVPLLNNFLPYHINLSSNKFEQLLFIIGIGVVVMFIGAGLRVLIANKQLPVNLLKNQFTSEKLNTRISNSLLVFQLIAFIGLVVVSVSMKKQLNFMQNFDFGFNQNYLISLNIDKADLKSFDTFKQELLNNPNIKAVTGTDCPPLVTHRAIYGILYRDSLGEQHLKQTEYVFADKDYLSTMEMTLESGQDISKIEKGFCIVNNTFIKDRGIINPVGTQVELGSSNYTIAGVIADFNQHSLREKINPFVIYLNPSKVKYALIRIQPEHIRKTITQIEECAKKILPQTPFEFHFMDKQVENQYQEERNASNLVLTLALVVIAISFFGLLGLSLLIAQNKIKEIGIRKVNGAKVSEILTMLNKDFVKWVAVAFVIATPVAYYAMHKWLENFAYKTTLSWWIFALSGLLALGIALLTVSWQSWRAATRNPVEALRYE